jgi:hypothetical protein
MRVNRFELSQTRMSRRLAGFDSGEWKVQNELRGLQFAPQCYDERTSRIERE